MSNIHNILFYLSIPLVDLLFLGVCIQQRRAELLISKRTVCSSDIPGGNIELMTSQRHATRWSHGMSASCEPEESPESQNFQNVGIRSGIEIRWNLPGRCRSLSSASQAEERCVFHRASGMAGGAVA